MIITKSEPFTKKETELLQEEYKGYIKTVIDVVNKICSAGMRMHVDGESLLLGQGSSQSDIWGGGIDVITKEIDYNSFINIRSSDNRSNIIESEQIRSQYRMLTEYFFKTIL